MMSAGAQHHFGGRKSLMVTAVLRDVVPSAKPVGNVLGWYHPELYPIVHRTLSHEEFQPSKFNLK